MPPVPILEFLLFITSLTLEAAIVGMVVSWGWVILRLARGLPLLPDRAFLPLPLASWGLGTILLVILLHVGAGNAAVVACRELFGINVGELVAKEKPAPLTKVGAEGTKPEGPEGEVDHDPLRSSSTARQMTIWAATYNTIFLMAFPWVFRRVSGAGAAELGLTTARWPEQLRVGVVAGLLAAPVVYAIQFLSLMIFKVNAHPIEKMLQDRFDPGLAFLALLSTVVLAPLTEEVMFRGVLQGWLTRAWSTLNARASRLAPRRGAVPTSPQEVIDPTRDLGPVGPAEDPRPGALNPVCWPAVVLTSMLFAALHGPQWPAPIALFAFSMMMGAVYQRTGSLLTSIAIHAMFNGCSTFLLLTQQLARSLDKPVAPEATPAAAVIDLLEWILLLSS